MVKLQDTVTVPKDNYFSFTDTSFVTGDSPATHDIIGSLSRQGVQGYLVNDGLGDLTFALSSDGTNFGDEVRMKSSDQPFNFCAFNIRKIRVTFVANSAYRIYVQ